MLDSFFRQLTLEEEKPFRQWARDNWKFGDKVQEVWHPVVRDEIQKMLGIDKPKLEELLVGIEDTLKFLREELKSGQDIANTCGCSRVEVNGKAFTTTYDHNENGTLTLKVMEVGNEM